MLSISELQAALDRCVADDYTVFVSVYNKSVHVSLSKKTYSIEAPIDLTVKGVGLTVAAAFENAFNNFPTTPLDGSKWASNRIAPIDGQFSEVKN